MDPTAEAEATCHRLTELALRLRSSTTYADPVLWAAASAFDTGALLLTAHIRREQLDPLTYHQEILAALGSARAAVTAATFAVYQAVNDPEQ